MELRTNSSKSASTWPAARRSTEATEAAIRRSPGRSTPDQSDNPAAALLGGQMNPLLDDGAPEFIACCRMLEKHPQFKKRDRTGRQTVTQSATVQRQTCRPGAQQSKGDLEGLERRA
jgi:hypothetical protein